MCSLDQSEAVIQELKIARTDLAIIWWRSPRATKVRFRRKQQPTGRCKYRTQVFYVLTKFCLVFPTLPPQKQARTSSFVCKFCMSDTGSQRLSCVHHHVMGDSPEDFLIQSGDYVSVYGGLTGHVVKVNFPSRRQQLTITIAYIDGTKGTVNYRSRSGGIMVNTEDAPEDLVPHSPKSDSDLEQGEDSSSQEQGGAFLESSEEREVEHSDEAFVATPDGSVCPATPVTRFAATSTGRRVRIRRRASTPRLTPVVDVSAGAAAPAEMVVERDGKEVLAICMARRLILQSYNGKISQELAVAFPDFAAQEAACLDEPLLASFAARHNIQQQIPNTTSVLQLGLRYFHELFNQAISTKIKEALATLVIPATQPTVWSSDDATLNAQDISYLIHICTQHRNGWPQTTEEVKELTTGASKVLPQTHTHTVLTYCTHPRSAVGLNPTPTRIRSTVRRLVSVAPQAER